MPSDIGKCISANNYHEGCAVTILPVGVDLANKILDVTRNKANKDWSAFANVVANKWKTIGYYYNDYPDSQLTSDVDAPNANTNAVINYSADAYGKHVLAGLAWSYNASPTSGNLKVEDGSGNTIFSVDITSAGPGQFTFPDNLQGTANTAMIITLNAAGSGVSGKLTTLGHKVE